MADLQSVHGLRCYDNIAGTRSVSECLYWLYAWFNLAATGSRWLIYLGTILVSDLYVYLNLGSSCIFFTCACVSLLIVLNGKFKLLTDIFVRRFLQAALRAAQTCRYLVYSEADFEVFRPAGVTRCTDGGEIWHGGWDRMSPPPCQISPPSVQ